MLYKHISSLAYKFCFFAVRLSDSRDGFSFLDESAASRPKKFHQTVDDIESHPFGNMLPDEEDLLTGMMDDLDLTELPDSADDYDLFGSGGGMELDTDSRWWSSKVIHFKSCWKCSSAVQCSKWCWNSYWRASLW